MRTGSVVRTAGLLAGLVLATGAAAQQTSVRTESVRVYDRMDPASEVVATLKKGDTVAIEMILQGENGAQWCAIQEPVAKKSLGYVNCADLERPQVARPAGVPLPAPMPVPASAEVNAPPAPSDFWAHSTLSEKIRKSCPEIDPDQLRYGWPLPKLASSIAADKCLAIAAGSWNRKLTVYEIRLWQAKADQSGAQACWDRYLAIRAKHRALALDKGALKRAKEARSEWERDPCYHRVEALQDAIALGPIRKILPQVYDDVMSGRQPGPPH